MVSFSLFVLTKTSFFYLKEWMGGAPLGGGGQAISSLFFPPLFGLPSTLLQHNHTFAVFFVQPLLFLHKRKISLRSVTVGVLENEYS